MSKRRVTLQLDEDLWRHIRLTALEMNTTASDFVEQAVRTLLEQNPALLPVRTPPKPTITKDA